MNKAQPAVVAVFDDRYQAEQAVRDLEEAGFDHNEVGFVMRGSEAVRGGMITDAVGAKDARGAMIGAAGGALTGGILGAAGSLLIPGIGPLVAAGFLGLTLGGMAAGTAVGGILGAMTGLGVSENEARYYDEQFNAGKAIIAVRANANEAEAERILRNHGAYNMRFAPQSPIPTSGILNKP